MTTDPNGRAEIQFFSDGSDDSPDTRCTYTPKNHAYVNNRAQGLAWVGAKSEDDGGFVPNKWVNVALNCDGPYCKMYVEGTRVANVPQYEFPRAGKIHVFMNVYRHGLFVDDLRVAAGRRALALRGSRIHRRDLDDGHHVRDRTAPRSFPGPTSRSARSSGCWPTSPSFASRSRATPTATARMQTTRA